MLLLLLDILDDLIDALTRSIDELTRPIDAIKHQAKTVTVGISRSEEGLLDRVLVRAALTLQQKSRLHQTLQEELS